MSRRSRFIAWGSTGGLIVAGIACAALIGGNTGPILAILLIGGAFVLATSLVFFEVGLSEDRERDREQRRASRIHPDQTPRRRLRRPQRRRRP
jgi:hypothetical protein